MSTAKRVTVRLDTKQACLVEELAARLEIPEVQVMRLALVTLSDRLPKSAGVTRVELSQDSKKVISNLTRQVQKVGSNTNQLLRVGYREDWNENLLDLIESAALKIDALPALITETVERELCQ